MSVFEKYVKQCRNPRGSFGRFVGRSMNISHSRVQDWGLRHISISSNANILDIGCGGGRAVHRLSKLAPYGKVYGIDFSVDMVDLASEVNKRRISEGFVEIMQGNVASLPFGDSFFDLVTAMESYYFWPNLIENLKEIRRVLKPAGCLLLVNEAYKDARFEKRNSYWVKTLEMTIHTPEEYRHFLSEAGYEKIEIDTIENKNWITAIVRPISGL